MTSTVLFAGGGTGGHLMPALAIADAMVAEDPTIEPFFVGAKRGVEATVLPSRKWRYQLLPFEPIYRRKWWKNFLLPFSAIRALRGVREILRREQPVLAIGTGGYASGPALWAATGRGIPIILQEQNAFPGYATRRLARQAAQIHLGFPEAESFLTPGPRTKVFDSGNPIVPPPADWLSVDGRRPTVDGKRALGFDSNRPLVLVTGGSQGAMGINAVVGQAIRTGRWPAEVQLLWQTGAAGFDQFKELSTVDCRLSTFIDPMASAWAAADLVIARGGASTSADIAAWGLPSVLIPLPTSAANHQLKNAQALSEAGAAVLLEQKKLTVDTLVSTVGNLLGDSAELAGIAAKAKLRGRPFAAREIAREALRLLSNS
ncbi:MAG TPA: UDP-N-acetylglucosamine--N-acetylmuramyl-(pentapeptide) pyrophosphoryl-undecaprenol N-acetylglucosamine transferase [Gemmatimonadales bacterium]